jgi:hypothetical protein
LDAPGRNVLFANKFERAFSRVVLPIHATGLPPADESDVENDRIVERRRGIGPGVSPRSRYRSKHGCSGKHPSHQLSN